MKRVIIKQIMGSIRFNNSNLLGDSLLDPTLEVIMPADFLCPMSRIIIFLETSVYYLSVHSN